MYDLYTGYNNNAANKDYKCLSSIKYQLVQGYMDEGTKLQCKYICSVVKTSRKPTFNNALMAKIECNSGGKRKKYRGVTGPTQNTLSHVIL